MASQRQCGVSASGWSVRLPEALCSQRRSGKRRQGGQTLREIERKVHPLNRAALGRLEERRLHMSYGAKESNAKEGTGLLAFVAGLTALSAGWAYAGGVIQFGLVALGVLG